MTTHGKDFRSFEDGTNQSRQFNQRLQEQDWLDQAADIMAARRLLAKEEANMRAAIAIYGFQGNSRV